MTDQSLMSQLYPMSFIPSTQSIYIEQRSSTDQATANPKPLAIAFRPIIPKALSKNVLSSTVDNLQQLSHSNTNFILTNIDQPENSSPYNRLTPTYQSLP